MDIATVQKVISGALTFWTPSAGTDSFEDQAPRRRSPIRVASWFTVGAIGVCVAACVTQGAGLPPATSEACEAKAREVVPSEASSRTSDLQRDRYYVYRACMHAAGLQH